MNIALDLEGVLADTNAAVLESTDKLSEQDVRGQWLQDEDDVKLQIYMGVSDAVWRHAPETIPPEDDGDVSRHVQQLRDDHTVDILTRREHVDDNVKWWLDKHNMLYDNFIPTGRDKWEYDYDLYIDDNPQMHGQCRLLLVDQPWNQQIDASNMKLTTRVHSLEEAIYYA